MYDLKSIAITSANKIGTAKVFEKPFKHLIVDNFLPEHLTYRADAEFPKRTSNIWEVQDDDVEKKLRSTYKSELDFPPYLQDIVRIMNTRAVLGAMSYSLGIPKLIPDPYFTGGGLNMSLRGGVLDVHVDGNYHDATGLNRRVNAILFLNPTWQSTWGGNFGLYNKDGEAVKSIEPLMNRLVIFDTHDESYHGMPEPLTCPENEERKSLILYYYTVAPREHIQWDKPHSALWAKNGFKDKKGKETREFK